MEQLASSNNFFLHSIGRRELTIASILDGTKVTFYFGHDFDRAILLPGYLVLPSAQQTHIYESPSIVKVRKIVGFSAKQAYQCKDLLLLSDGREVREMTKISPKEGYSDRKLMELKGGESAMKAFLHGERLVVTFKAGEEVLVYEFREEVGLDDHKRIRTPQGEQLVDVLFPLAREVILVKKQDKFAAVFKMREYELMCSIKYKYIGGLVNESQIAVLAFENEDLVLVVQVNYSQSHFSKITLQKVIRQMGHRLVHCNNRLQPVFSYKGQPAKFESRTIDPQSLAKLLADDFVLGLQLVQNGRAGPIQNQKLVEQLFSNFQLYSDVLRKLSPYLADWQHVFQRILHRVVLAEESIHKAEERLFDRIKQVNLQVLRHTELSITLNVRFTSLIQQALEKQQIKSLLTSQNIDSALLPFCLYYFVNAVFSQPAKMIEWLNWQSLESLYRPIIQLQSLIMKNESSSQHNNKVTLAVQAIVSGDALYEPRIAAAVLKLSCFFGRPELTFALLFSGKTSVPQEVLVGVHMRFGKVAECYFVLKQKYGEVPRQFWELAMQNGGVRECFEIRMEDEERAAFSQLVRSRYPQYQRFLKEVAVM